MVATSPGQTADGRLDGDNWPPQSRTPFPAGTRVRVSKPDGSYAELRVADVQINPAGVVGLFFADVELLIPRGSVIQQLD